MRVPPVSFAGNWVEWNRQCRPLPTWLGSALACSLPGAELACGISNAIPGGKTIGVGGTVSPGIDGFGRSGACISAVWRDGMARYARYA